MPHHRSAAWIGQSFPLKIVLVLVNSSDIISTPQINTQRHKIKGHYSCYPSRRLPGRHHRRWAFPLSGKPRTIWRPFRRNCFFFHVASRSNIGLIIHVSDAIFQANSAKSVDHCFDDFCTKLARQQRLAAPRSSLGSWLLILFSDWCSPIIADWSAGRHAVRASADGKVKR